MEDGREICLQNADGRAEYKRRKMLMWQRQSGLCSLGKEPIRLIDGEFEHAEGRTSGRRDDRIVDEKGNPINSLACRKHNRAKGSKHFQPPIPRGFDPAPDSV
jgi:hypothetical protein